MGSYALLINLLVVLVSILFIQLWMNKPNIKRVQFELVVFFSFSIAIVLCINYPFIINNSFLCDLRNIPFVLACFYAHRLTGLGLAFTVIISRFFYGGDGAWLNLMITPFIFILTMMVRPYFERSTSFVKMLIATGFMGILSLVILASIKYFFQAPFPSELWVSFLAIEMVGMLIAIFMAETIRKQHHMSLQLIRMEKLEVVSHLAASIAHEIRNPLTTSRGFLQLGVESKNVPAEEKEYLSIALTEMDRAEEIIQDYLTFAKPVHEDIELLDLKESAEKAVKVIQPLANLNSVNIVHDLKSYHTTGNAGYFQQAIINLLKNSIEAMPEGGTIEISLEQDQSHASLKIVDYGVGMTTTQIHRLGEPYFSTKESKGTGLGMMVVYRVIESMKGTVLIQSEVGRGTEITLQFPLSHQSQLTKEPGFPN